MVVWIMGLASSGKSSTAKELELLLKMRGIECLLLDGNHLRELFDIQQYDRQSRIALGIKYANLAKNLADNKIIIIAANGMLKEVSAYNRAHISDYVEVFLDVPFSVLQKRDTNGIYSDFKKGLVKNVGGLDLEVDVPNADLRFEYKASQSAADIAAKIYEFIYKQKSNKLKKSSKSSKFSFESKAKTLQMLESKLKSAKILPLYRLSYAEFSKNFNTKKIYSKLNLSLDSKLIVRSTCSAEDKVESSNAGVFSSILSVCESNLQEAIQEVFNSYKKASVDIENEEVLIQPMLDSKDVVLSGVAFSREPKSNAPYFVIEYASNSTDAVTSGSGKVSKLIHSHFAKPPKNPYMKKVVSLLKELDNIFCQMPLDVEFGIDKNDIFCFQVRPLNCEDSTNTLTQNKLKNLESKIDFLLAKKPFLYGEKGILGVMPDWNPAEMIGLHPKPLSFSLYRWLISESTYAKARAKYGYRDIVGNPLIFDLHGRAFVDVRASFNSFIPASLEPQIASKLVDFYLNKLRVNKHLHDKVEFEIIFCGYYFDTLDRLKELKKHHFSDDEIACIAKSLKFLTNEIINKKPYLDDIKKLSLLQDSRQRLLDCTQNPLEKIYWLLNHCKAYGTLPFAALARMGFMAVAFLNSLISKGVLTKEQKDLFINSLENITSDLNKDLHTLSKEQFLSKYGHLRPGTYDILSPSYKDNFLLYFDKKSAKSHTKSDFSLSLKQLKNIENLLKSHGIESSVLEFFEFIEMGIIYRERAKFEFSKNVSLALDLIAQLGKSYHLSKEDMSFCSVEAFLKAYSTSNDPLSLILESINANKERFAKQKQILLPSLITDKSQVFSNFEQEFSANFITQKRVLGEVLQLESSSKNAKLDSKIIAIKGADPGFDFIFSHKIAGFITEFGGANSHMAIRANELGIPAVIGLGSKFESYSKASVLEIDCENKKVEIIK